MKAVLVIDMPNSCDDCELNRDYNDIHIYCNHPCNTAIYGEIVPDWCPLRSLPDKIEVKVDKIEDTMHTELKLTDIFSNKIMTEVKFETDKLIALGYNACLEDILGGE